MKFRNNAARTAMMNTIDDDFASKKAELNNLRPIAHASAVELEQWYDVELTYTSNAIENNSLTRSETAIVLEKGFTIAGHAGKPLRDHMEAVGHKDALNDVRVLAQGEERIREMDVRHIHQLIVVRSDPEHAGQYSQHQRMISGSLFVLPSPSEISPLMSDFGRWLSESLPNAENAFAAHEKLVTIYPFTDGNG
jgi:Fic family protein